MPEPLTVRVLRAVDAGEDHVKVIAAHVGVSPEAVNSALGLLLADGTVERRPLVTHRQGRPIFLYQRRVAVVESR